MRRFSLHTLWLPVFLYAGMSLPLVVAQVPTTRRSPTVGADTVPPDPANLDLTPNAPAGNPNAADPIPPTSTDGGMGKNHFRNFKKIRPGSFIRREPEEISLSDLRSEHQMRQDYQVALHYERLAKLDVIEQIASTTQDASLSDWATNVRRNELVRYRLVMARLRRATRRAQLLGGRLD